MLGGERERFNDIGSLLFFVFFFARIQSYMYSLVLHSKCNSIGVGILFGTEERIKYLPYSTVEYKYASMITPRPELK